MLSIRGEREADQKSVWVVLYVLQIIFSCYKKREYSLSVLSLHPDVNECTNATPACRASSSTCNNTIGSFHCDCLAGHQHFVGMKTCNRKRSPTRAFWRLCACVCALLFLWTLSVGGLFLPWPLRPTGYHVSPLKREGTRKKERNRSSEIGNTVRKCSVRERDREWVCEREFVRDREWVCEREFVRDGDRVIETERLREREGIRDRHGDRS